jgi:hypothetical protein
MHRSRKLIAIGLCAFLLFILMAIIPFLKSVVQERDVNEDPLAIATALAITEQDEEGRLPKDRSKPVPSKAEVANAWQKRQDLFKTARFAWTEQQTHPKGWLPNPRFPEREWLNIPGLLIDRSYIVSKTLSLDGNKMRYTFEIDRKEEPDGVDVIVRGKPFDNGLGVRRKYSYVSVFDGQVGKTLVTSMATSTPPALRQVTWNVDAQNLDTRPILMLLRAVDPAMGHLLMDRAVVTGVRFVYKGRSLINLEERHDPSGWKTAIWLEPERDFVVTRYRIYFEQKFMVDIKIDYAEDARWGWFPSGWQVVEMIADGSTQVVVVAKVSSFNINLPIGIEEFR